MDGAYRVGDSGGAWAGLRDFYSFSRIKADNVDLAPVRDYRRASRCHA